MAMKKAKAAKKPAGKKKVAHELHKKAPHKKPAARRM